MAGLGRLGGILLLMLPPSPGSAEHFWTYLGALGQTLSIAFFGTTVASAIALPLGFLSARNVVAGRILHFLTRRGLDCVRSVDTLIWALIWINVVGLGPFAGALAIACTDLAALAKLMSEAIETASTGSGRGRAGQRRRPARGDPLRPAAAGAADLRRSGAVLFESNTRSATIIGIVGAGGIGLYLSEMIRVLEWREASFLILMVLIAVAAIDAVSSRLRAAIMGAPRT